MDLGRRDATARGRCLADRQPHDKLAAPSGPLAAGGDRAAMQLHQRAHDREADAQTSGGMGQRPVPLAEQIENTRYELRGHSTPIVAARSTTCCPSRAATTRICPCGGVYFAALFTRFVITCASRTGSASRATGS